MPKDVIWSPLAEDDLANVLDYLHKNWSVATAENFLTKIDSTVERIRLNPKIHRMINKELRIRKCVITTHNTLYYRDREEQIEILRLFDTRQNPKKLGFSSE